MKNSRIIEERKKLGLNQEELATKLKISQKSISKYECGTRRPSYETLVAMSSLFGVSVDYLLGNDVSKETSEKPNKETKNTYKPEVHITHKEEQLLDLYRTYLDKGFSEQFKKDLLNLFPELEKNELKLSRSEEKILTTFKNLNEDNQDIIIGKTKELLREQRYEEAITEESLLKKAK